MLVDVLKSMVILECGEIILTSTIKSIQNETDPDGIANRSADPEFYREIIEDSREWDELPYSMRFKLFEPWHYFSTFGALIQILGSLIILADQLRFSHTEYHKGQLGLVGMGTFFAWIQLLCYLSFNQNLTLITSILSKSLKTILVFYGIYIPIFISFGLLGNPTCCVSEIINYSGQAMRFSGNMMSLSQQGQRCKSYLLQPEEISSMRFLVMCTTKDHLSRSTCFSIWLCSSPRSKTFSSPSLWTVTRCQKFASRSIMTTLSRPLKARRRPFERIG